MYIALLNARPWEGEGWGSELKRKGWINNSLWSLIFLFQTPVSLFQPDSYLCTSVKVSNQEQYIGLLNNFICILLQLSDIFIKCALSCLFPR